MPPRARPPRGPAATARPTRRGPIRGFPPTPGQPDPVYPPGQFSTWNKPSVRAAWLGIARIGDGTGQPEAEPDYSLLATSDPSADSTATQTWPVIDGDLPGGGWSAREARDWGSHAEETARITPARTPPRPGTAPQRGTAGTPQRDGGARGQAGQRAAGPGDQAPARGARRPQPRGEPAPQAAPAGRKSAGGTAGGAAKGRRTGRTHKRGNAMMAALLLSPVLVVVLVVVGYVYEAGRHATPVPHAALPSHTAPVSASPTPTLGPWKHIQSRTLDTLPLSLTELFPSRFAAGGMAGARTIDRAGSKCTHAVIGSALQAAVHKAHCTQVLRASYLSDSHKLMATIGVLNLLDAKAAERVGRASGAREFIKQLPAKHGPTRRLSKGTGLEEADVVGHYLILTWAEFANLHKPSGKKQLRELKSFSAALITGTANVSLTSRMVTGKPRTP